MIGRPPISTLTDILFPNTTLFRAFLRRPPGKIGGDALDADAAPIVERPRLSRRRRRDVERRDGQPLLRQPPAVAPVAVGKAERRARRSEEHTSELQSLMRISYAVFCLKKHKYYEKNE